METKELVNKCNKCEYTNTNGNDMKIHMEEYHTIKTIQCTFKKCNFTTEIQSTMKEHIKNKHNKKEHNETYHRTKFVLKN